MALALSQEHGAQVQCVRYLSKELQAALQQLEKRRDIRKRLVGRSTASVRSTIHLKLAALEYGEAPDPYAPWKRKDVEARLARLASKVPGGVGNY